MQLGFSLILIFLIKLEALKVANLPNALYIATSIYANDVDQFLPDLWSLFVKKYNQSFQSKAQEEYRLNIFRTNLLFIVKKNSDYLKNISTYEMITNEFSDKDMNEISYLLGFNGNTLQYFHNPKLYFIPPSSNQTLPKSVDWRKMNVVTQVKKQKKPKSSWAFSATGAIESHYALSHKLLYTFSEDQLIECGPNKISANKSLDNMDNAFGYAQEEGLALHEVYKDRAQYRNKLRNACMYMSNMKVASVINYINIKEEDEYKLMQAVYHKGPVSAAINVKRSFLLYKSGIYDEEDCGHGRHNLNHAVLLVGFGEQQNVLYWIVKNSWGLNWGENGYIRMLRGKNLCGIATWASYPIV